MTKQMTINDKAKVKKRIKAIIWYSVAVFFVFWHIWSYLYMISKSLMPGLESSEIPVRFFPSRITFEGYVSALDSRFFRYLWNSVIVMVLCTGGSMITGILCSYAFAKCEWKAKGFWFSCVLSTMMMPGIVLQIPSYVIYIKVFNWANSLKPLWVTGWFGGGAMSIFMMRQFMLSVPQDIDDAAKIDGASSLRRLFVIYVPLIKPILIYQTISAIMNISNDFSTPLVYITNEKLFTLPLGIYLKYTGVDYEGLYANSMMATGVILSIPSIIIFAFFQKQLVDGIMIGSLKG